MEPLIATDWLKDYDPLFDLFDEEMRCSSSTQAGMSADYLNEYDLNNNYYNSCYKQTDELSLILGLEWMPCLDLNSPSTSSSSSVNSTNPSSNPCSQANNSRANSQCLSTTSSSSSSTTTTTTTLSSSSPIITTVIDSNQQAPQNLQQNATKITTINNDNDNNNHNNINTTNSTGQQEQRVFRIQLQNNVSTNKLGNSINNNSFAISSDFGSTPSTNGGALKQKSCLVVNSNNNLIASSLVDTTQIVNCASTNLKRKKKCPKTKGTSLLAQPSKLSNNSTSSSTAPTRTSNKTIMPTLITINRPSTMMTPLQQQQVLPKTTTLLSTTTTLTNKNNQITPLTYIANGTLGINSSNNNNLKKSDRTMRYCIKIEHAYSSIMC